jgi:protein DGCR14
MWVIYKELCLGVALTPEQEVEMASRRRVIVHSNTHFTRNPFDEQQNQETIHLLAQSQAQTLEGKIGVDGKELIQPETPNINGFSFVKTPSPVPGTYRKQDVM